VPVDVQKQEVRIPTAGTFVEGDLRVPADTVGLVVFAHGSGSSRFSSRNRQVAEYLEEHGFATLLLDLLTKSEDEVDKRTTEYRFDIQLLTGRVTAAIDWAASRPDLAPLPICCFGASTGAAAALVAAGDRPERVRAVISRGGRPDLAGGALPYVQAPTLLIVGSRDQPVIELNREAQSRMLAPVRLEIVPGATHLFVEPGALDDVCRLAAAWCWQHLDTLSRPQT
jgi:dienelactone hydrolase